MQQTTQEADENVTTLHVNRHNLIRAYQSQHWTAAPHKQVYADPVSGETRLRYDSPGIEWVEIKTDAFIEDDTDADALIDEPGPTTDALDAWESTIQLRDELPEHYTDPITVPVHVKYTAADDRGDQDAHDDDGEPVPWEFDLDKPRPDGVSEPAPVAARRRERRGDDEPRGD